MNHREPPALATWMLDHLRSRGTDEALSGDLLEAFRSGRSAGWYWYQVIVAIAIAWGRNVWRHRITLFFAAIWSVFSPAWLLLPVRFSLDSLVGDTSQIPWPWSFICACVFAAVIAMLFIWLGVAVYSTLHLLAFGKLFVRSVRKGFLWGYWHTLCRSRLATQSTGEASRCLVRVRFCAFHISSELRLHCGFLRQETSQNKYVPHSFAQGRRRGLQSQGRNRDANRPPSPI
jgi:hypothetical protein